MTNEELKQWAQSARTRASRVGSMSGLWDLIYDAEAHANGREALLSREQTEELVQKDLAK